MFKIGDYIVHPMHGAGVIETIEEKKINGEIKQYYILTLSYNKMVIMLPVDRCVDIGVRGVISSHEADSIISSFPSIATMTYDNWNQRYKDNLEKMQSGDLMKVSAVVKALKLQDKIKSLSTGERKMYNMAKQILFSELSIAKGVSYLEIEKEIDSILD